MKQAKITDNYRIQQSHKKNILEKSLNRINFAKRKYLPFEQYTENINRKK